MTPEKVKLSYKKEQRGGINIKGKSEKIGYAMLAPFYLFYLVFILIPVIYVIYYSFTNYDFYRTKDFVGFQNYISLFTDKQFVRAFFNTLEYGLFTVTGQLILGLMAALALNRGLKFQRFDRVGFYLPYIISMVTASMIWLWILNPSYGFLNQILIKAGFSPKMWLSDLDTAMGCIIVMSIWKSLGYNMTVYLSGLLAIPSNLYEAASIDGAGEWSRFWYITLPMLRPTAFFLFVTACINAFKAFEQVNIMTDGGPLSSTTTIVHQIYTKAFKEFNMGYACSMAVVLLILVSTVTMINFKLGSKGNDAEL